MKMSQGAFQAEEIPCTKFRVRKRALRDPKELRHFFESVYIANEQAKHNTNLNLGL